MKFLTLAPFADSIIRSNGFAVFVMFGMMTAMAYTLWNQYNKTNERLSLVEQQVLECYKANSEKTNAIIEKNTAVMEQVIYKLNK
jgi:predicted negative regulator of RcsB-dependent stress response